MLCDMLCDVLSGCGFYLGWSYNLC